MISAPRTIYLETFGCQMNELDSELVRGHLAAIGYRFITTPDAADIILYNTCSVREQAENKVLSRVGIVGAEKKEAGRHVILGVIGCMAEREGPAMMRRFPQIDLMCGPGELDKLPMLLDNALKTEAALIGATRPGSRGSLDDRIALQGSNSRRSATLAAAEDNLEMLDLSRAFDPDHATSRSNSAYVRITRGCNKFCTYCVVPHTRGPEVHRPPDSIIDECKRLADAGVIEITLLGQTVNHYIYTHGLALTVDGREAPQVGPGLSAFRRNVQTSTRPNVQISGSTATVGVDARPRLGHAALGHPDAHSVSTCGRFDVSRRTTTFADLLHRIHEEVPAIQRLRFVTSYPRDFGDDILHVMAASPRICPYLHVPAQSGSNRILKLMNRGYTVEQYLEFINRALTLLPGASIAGDIIVGFPTETEEDFEMTKALLRRVPFKNNFIFKYSPRPGTAAIDRLPDDVPDEIKRRRNNELLALQSEISAKVHESYIGRTLDVFIERITNRTVHPGAPAREIALTISGQARSQNGAQNDALHSELRTRNSALSVQLSGRTAGDLIVAFDAPPSGGGGAKRAMRDAGDVGGVWGPGTIVPVRITSAGPLILRGELAG